MEDWADSFTKAQREMPYARHYAEMGEWENARHSMEMTRVYLYQAIEALKPNLTDTTKDPT